MAALSLTMQHLHLYLLQMEYKEVEALLLETKLMEEEEVPCS